MSNGAFPYPTGDSDRYQGLDDNVDSEALEKKRAEFALECRKVRLWIATHPNATSHEIKAACGSRYDMCLAKLISMRIVRVERTKREPRGFVNKWFVVPAPDLKFDVSFMPNLNPKEGIPTW